MLALIAGTFTGNRLKFLVHGDRLLSPLSSLSMRLTAMRVSFRTPLDGSTDFQDIVK